MQGVGGGEGAAFRNIGSRVFAGVRGYIQVDRQSV